MKFSFLSKFSRLNLKFALSSSKADFRLLSRLREQQDLAMITRFKQKQSLPFFIIVYDQTLNYSDYAINKFELVILGYFTFFRIDNTYYSMSNSYLNNSKADNDFSFQAFRKGLNEDTRTLRNLFSQITRSLLYHKTFVAVCDRLKTR